MTVTPPQSPRRLWRRLLVGTVLLGLLLTAAVVGGRYAAHQALIQPLLVADDPPLLALRRGQRAEDLLMALVERQHIAPWQAFFAGIALRWTGQARRLRPGDYAVTAKLTLGQLLARVAAGEVAQARFTVVEGWRFLQFRQQLEGHPLVVATFAGQPDTAIMAALGHPTLPAEGRFMPLTYTVKPRTPDLVIYRQAFDAMTQRLERIWATRQADVPLKSADELLVLASMIEKEAGPRDDFGDIAGVFVRRLQKNMRLQSDPTVIYGRDAARQGDLTRTDLRTDTPFNTYTRSGLPPTPIALPSERALRAAAHPNPGTALYFVADGQGGHVFSDTLEAHNRAVAAYRDWQRRQGLR